MTEQELKKEFGADYKLLLVKASKETCRWCDGKGLVTGKLCICLSRAKLIKQAAKDKFITGD